MLVFLVAAGGPCSGEACRHPEQLCGEDWQPEEEHAWVGLLLRGLLVSNLQLTAFSPMASTVGSP